MKVLVVLSVCVFLVAAVLVPTGAWSATMTMDDVKKEMPQNARPFWGERPVMYVPMAEFNNLHMTLMDLCVANGRLHPLAQGATATDQGPAPQGNEYSVLIMSRDGGGYDSFQYERRVSIPPCK